MSWLINDSNELQVKLKFILKRDFYWFNKIVSRALIALLQYSFTTLAEIFSFIRGNVIHKSDVIIAFNFFQVEKTRTKKGRFLQHRTAEINSGLCSRLKLPQAQCRSV